MIPILLGLATTTAIILFIVGLRYSDTGKSRLKTMSVAPTVSKSEGLITDDKKSKTLIQKYQHGWSQAAKGAGFSDKSSTNMALVTTAISAMTALMVFSLTQVVVISIFVSLSPPAAAWLYLNGKASKRSVLIEKQMSSFVVSIHMYIQSGQQPVTAIMQAVDAQPEPLKSELFYLITSLKNNENEQVAFRKLRDRTANAELKELCSNMAIALSEGSDVGKQLMNLGDTVRAKGELRGKIQGLLQDPRMTSVIGFLSFFVFFVISWFSQENAQETWSTLMGSIVLIACSASAGAGGIWAYKIVKRAQGSS